MIFRIYIICREIHLWTESESSFLGNCWHLTNPWSMHFEISDMSQPEQRYFKFQHLPKHCQSLPSLEALQSFGPSFAWSFTMVHVVHVVLVSAKALVWRHGVDVRSNHQVTKVLKSAEAHGQYLDACSRKVCWSSCLKLSPGMSWPISVISWHSQHPLCLSWTHLFFQYLCLTKLI
jgi:hypothetical protein